MFSSPPRSILSRGSSELCKVVRELVSGSRHDFLNAVSIAMLCVQVNDCPHAFIDAESKPPRARAYCRCGWGQRTAFAMHTVNVPPTYGCRGRTCWSWICVERRPSFRMQKSHSDAASISRVSGSGSPSLYPPLVQALTRDCHIP